MQIHLITAVSVIKRLSSYEFTFWGRDLVSVVHIRESPCYRGLLPRWTLHLNLLVNFESSPLPVSGVGKVNYRGKRYY